MTVRGQGSAVLVAAVAALLGACDPNDIQAVGAPGGAFRSGAGCVLEALEAGGPQSCQAPAQLGFERLADVALVEVPTSNLSQISVSCRRSYCGAGSLALHAEYRWPQGQSTPTEGERLGQIRYRFAQPVDLYGQTVTYTIYVDGPATPMNAYVAVMERGNRFRMVQDSVLYQLPRWSERGAAIRADNPELELPEGTSSLMVTEILISVYLATAVRTGDRVHWSGDIFIDDVRWQ